ncbi:IS66 family transposase, partial [Dysosmobacter welbionis]
RLHRYADPRQHRGANAPACAKSGLFFWTGHCPAILMAESTRAADCRPCGASGRKPPLWGRGSKKGGRPSGQPPRGLSLCQKSLEDPVLRFLLGEAQGLQLQQLVPGDLADGGLVDQLGLGVVGGDLRHGADLGLSHNNGVALHMAEALGVAHHAGAEHLGGLVLGHRPGDDPALGVLTVQLDDHVAVRHLAAVGQQPLCDDGLGPLAADDLGVPLGGVHAPDLHRVHLDGGALLQIHDGLGVHDLLAPAVPLSVVLFRVVDMGVFAHMEGVDAVVAGLLVAAVVDAAAGHDLHIAVPADVEVVVHRLFHTGLGDDDGDVAGLALGPV